MVRYEVYLRRSELRKFGKMQGSLWLDGKQDWGVCLMGPEGQVQVKESLWRAIEDDYWVVALEVDMTGGGYPALMLSCLGEA